MSNKAFKVKHGLELPNGTSIDEISIDTTLAGNSDDGNMYTWNEETTSWVEVNVN